MLRDRHRSGAKSEGKKIVFSMGRLEINPHIFFSKITFWRCGGRVGR
jgi:hypothetical protein